MKKHLLLLLAFIFSLNSVAQTTLFSEDFETGNTFTLNSTDLGATTSFNTWLVNNSFTGGGGTFFCFGFPFSFTVSNTPTQPVGITNAPQSNYMHITAQAAISSGITCASYIPSDGGTCVANESNFSKMTAPISTLGFTNVTLDFWWMCGGSSDAYGEVYYSIDGGTSWVLKQSNMNNVTSWSQTAFSDVAWDNIANLQFAYRFVNNTASTETDPPFSIDDIIVTGDNTLNVTNIDSFVDLVIYPNPTNRDINILFNKTYKDIKVNIVDITGKKIQSNHFTNEKELNLQLFANKGIYFLNITADSKILNYRIIKQ